MSSGLLNYSNTAGGKTESSPSYDLVVIGGGSGGLACAKQAADFGKRVAVIDYVTPSPQGSTWGLGGTCVNVGCIPKKLMHQASLIGHSMADASSFGWKTTDVPKHDWASLVEAVQSHIKSINWGHRTQLHVKGVDYVNGFGSLRDRETVQATLKDGSEKLLKTSNVVVSVGTRPRYPDIPGAEQFCISSDDLFSMSKPPGKTLVIGASYVALECAGFLTGLGFDTTVMMRSIPLRGFDQQMASLIKDNMVETGTTFMEIAVPVSVEKLTDDTLLVKYTQDGAEKHECYDTVLMAMGRTALTSDLGLGDVGVNLDAESYKIIGSPDDSEQSSANNIYAIGDVLHNRPELTPVAIKAGKLLSARLFSYSKQKMDYDNVPTTVFTPLEYGCVGLSEESALEKYSEDDIEVYHAFYRPLEYTLSGRSAEQCYTKMICKRNSDQEVLGIHFLGPNAGEVIQGFGLAMKCGLTRNDVIHTVGIHPTCAEESIRMHITKRSGLDARVTGC